MSKKQANTKTLDSSRKDFDKYFYYSKSVQSPETDVEFFKDTYKELKGKKAKVLREDFCGTFLICQEWAKLNKSHFAVGVDYDSEPIDYGKKNYLPNLTDEQQKRVETVKRDVLSNKLPEADIAVAVNFSYYIFKERATLLKYFTNCYKSLNKKGVFLIDCFGGSQCMEPIEEETEHEDEGFSYFWDQDSYDPVTNYAQFYIHFKRKGEKKREKVFSYDWRMWSIPELRDLLKEAGFAKTHVYWEGTTKDGEGDGNFKRTEKGEDCDAWVSYIAAEKTK